MGHRRAPDGRAASFVRGGAAGDPWLPVTFVVIPLVVYIATWSGWFATSTGYYRDYAQQHGVHTPVISALYSLYEYHRRRSRSAWACAPRTRTSPSRGTGC